MAKIWETSEEFGGIDTRCFAIFDAPFIGFKGQLYGCCSGNSNMLPNEEDSIFDMDLMQALNSPKYLYMKKLITGKEALKDDIVCSRCNAYERMQKLNKWLNLKFKLTR